MGLKSTSPVLRKQSTSLLESILTHRSKRCDMYPADRERILTLQALSHQRLNVTRRSVDRLTRCFDAQDRLHNFEDSTNVKRLFILATVFLPLSLVTSMLSMSTRFKDLKLILYDLLGVSVIVGLAAVIFLFGVWLVADSRSSKDGLWKRVRSVRNVSATKGSPLRCCTP